MQSTPIQTQNVFTYRRIRRVIGWLGILLPFALVLISLFSPAIQVQQSISHYYYTDLREIFTGTLCAVGLFMICYKGQGNAKWYRNDNILTNIAGVMAMGVALLPTNPDEACQKIYSLIPHVTPALGWIHYGCAGILFLCFSLLSINVFTIGQNQDTDLPVRMLNENHIYRFGGYSILVYIALIFILGQLSVCYSTLILEAISLFTFGMVWLIKGRGLGDTGKMGEILYREKHFKSDKHAPKDQYSNDGAE